MIRRAISDFVREGRLPAQDQATQSRIERLERLLKVIEEPVTDQEAEALLGTFGPDGCFGLAWLVLHLIESAPGALAADYSDHADNDWGKLLEDRRAGDE